jgi:hypothetical protein
VVELYDYTESEQEFVLLMEYCNDANYFQDKIEDVRIYVSSYKHLEAHTYYESGEALVVCVRYTYRSRVYTQSGSHP